MVDDPKVEISDLSEVERVFLAGVMYGMAFQTLKRILTDLSKSENS